MQLVSIEKCESYNEKEVELSLTKCIDQIEGMKDKLQNKKVLLKVNLLMKKSPEDAVTTHPGVVEALVRYLQKLNCEVIIGDSPGGPFTEWMLKSIYKASGMAEVANNTGCQLNYNIESAHIENNKAKMLKSMDIIDVITKVDCVISVAKLKTHGMMTYTGAVKNLFGVIPGLIKADYHLKMNNTINFAEHLVDICEYVSPVLSIIDGIEGMEGDGPSAGSKRHVGLLMASENPYALDTVASNIIGIKANMIPTIIVAKERGIFSGNLNEINIVGTDVKTINIPPFTLPKSMNVNFIGGIVPKFVENVLINNLRPKPIFDYNKCVSCGDCSRSCPAKVIDMGSGKPVIDLDKCIRCFCCHELCPRKAVDIKQHWIYEKVFK